MKINELLNFKTLDFSKFYVFKNLKTFKTYNFKTHFCQLWTMVAVDEKFEMLFVFATIPYVAYIWRNYVFTYLYLSDNGLVKHSF